MKNARISNGFSHSSRKTSRSLMNLTSPSMYARHFLSVLREGLPDLERGLTGLMILLFLGGTGAVPHRASSQFHLHC